MLWIILKWVGIICLVLVVTAIIRYYTESSRMKLALLALLKEDGGAVEGRKLRQRLLEQKRFPPFLAYDLFWVIMYELEVRGMIYAWHIDKLLHYRLIKKGADFLAHHPSQATT
jgi:hypothetical protein